MHCSSLYIPPYAVLPFKNMFHKFLTSSGDSTAAAILKQVRTRPELRLLIVPGISPSTVDAKVTASQHHNRGQAQFTWGGRGKTKARLACDVISVFLAMISLDGAQLLQQ